MTKMKPASRLPMERGATLSLCGRYRYSLTRRWSDDAACVGFIMLNPSTADHVIDDPTIRRCIAFARDWTFGSLEVCNLFAFRASRPSALLNNPDPLGPGNDTAIEEMLGRVEITVAAWGASPLAPGRIPRLYEMLSAAKLLFCLGRTKSGAPRHPLYVPASTRLEIYAPWRDISSQSS